MKAKLRCPLIELWFPALLNQKGQTRAKVCGGLLKSRGAERFAEVGGAGFPLLESAAFSTGFDFWLRFPSRERPGRSRELWQGSLKWVSSLPLCWRPLAAWVSALREASGTGAEPSTAVPAGPGGRRPSCCDTDAGLSALGRIHSVCARAGTDVSSRTSLREFAASFLKCLGEPLWQHKY